MNMKRKLTIILAVLVAIAAVIVGVRIRFNEPLPKGSQDEQVKAIPVSYTHLTLPTICSV